MRTDAPANFQDEAVISLNEFARLANISLTTARRLRSRGELPIIKLSPRRIGLRIGRAKQWLREREIAAFNA